jgi:hypothetical protein
VKSTGFGERQMSRRDLLALAARAGAVTAAAPVVAGLTACARTLPLASMTLAPEPVGPSAAVKLKPPLQGFLDEAQPPLYDWMLGYVRNLDWSELQATAQGPIIMNSRLLSDIQAVRAFNTAHPTQAPRGLKLRTGAAGGAPADVKAIGGGPFRVTDPGPPPISAGVGAFWLPEYQAAYADFQTKLAAWLDPIPEVREVTMALPALIYEEPFTRYSTSSLERGHWTVALDEKSFTAMLTAHRVWKTTRQDLAYTIYNAPGGSKDFQLTFLTAARADFGAQLVNGNNAINANSTNSPLYEAITRAGPPIYFQTAGARRLGSPSAAYAFGIAHGANSIEIQKYSGIAESLLLASQRKLLANPI